MRNKTKAAPTRREFIQSTLATGLAFGASRRLFALPVMPSSASLANDPRRPQFHLLPARNWMNDPNAPIYWKGKYHMFFQYNPHAAVWGDMHWYHAVSPDMVHWKHLPVALAPTPGGPDADGCFSGSAVSDVDRVVMIYTGVVKVSSEEATLRDGNSSLRETQCVAVATGPNLDHWEKDPVPVIPKPPAGLKITGFRDPSVWRDGTDWFMVVGSGIEGQGGVILLYSSTDLKYWKYRHILISGKKNDKHGTNPVDTGEMWECPDFFQLGNKHVLIYSTEGKVLWQSGILDHTTMLFHPEQNGILDHGSFYAPKTQLDAHGNRILWGWIPESRPSAEYSASGWSGMMSVPRKLELDSNGRLQITPVETLQILRGKQASMEPSNPVVLRQANGEISLKLKHLKTPFNLSLTLSGSSSAAEASILVIGYDPSTRKLIMDDKSVPLSGVSTDDLSIRMFVDGSVIEAFINGSEAFTKRFYYAGDKAPDITLSLTGVHESQRALTIWPITPISSDRLTTPNIVS